MYFDSLKVFCTVGATFTMRKNSTAFVNNQPKKSLCHYNYFVFSVLCASS